MIFILHHILYKFIDTPDVLGRNIAKENGRIETILAIGHRLDTHHDPMTGDLFRSNPVILAEWQKQMDPKPGHGLQPLIHTAKSPGTT